MADAAPPFTPQTRLELPPLALPGDHPKVRAGRIGVLLVNLGSPDAPDVPSVRRFLGEFLSDPRVIEIPQIIWRPILNLIILNLRPRTTAANYAKVWTPEGSPITVYTRRQAELLAQQLGSAAQVDWAMRYGTRSIEERLLALQADGCDRILLVPLYPQYSAATNATVVDEANRALADMRWQPALRTMPPYFDNPDHVSALAANIRQQLAGLDFVPQLIVTSFHGMPQRTLEAGDPYHCQCRKTGRLLEAELGLPVRVTFQSRFGRAEWLKPYTDATLEALPGEGITRIAVTCPGFAADCLETLEEVAMEGKESFIHAGGENFAYLPCLNDGAIGMAMLETLVRRELAGWL
jgi:ferrochelatase